MALSRIYTCADLCARQEQRMEERELSRAARAEKEEFAEIDKLDSMQYQNANKEKQAHMMNLAKTQKLTRWL